MRDSNSSGATTSTTSTYEEFLQARRNSAALGAAIPANCMQFATEILVQFIEEWANLDEASRTELQRLLPQTCSELQTELERATESRMKNSKGP